MSNEKLYVNLWIGNLGKYNEGELVGEWFSLPCDMEEVSKVIGLNEEYEEYQINDFETNIPGLKIDHYDNINTLNEFMEKVDQLDDTEQLVLQAWMDQYGNDNILKDFDDINFDDVMIYHDVKDMSDVAYAYMEESGQLAEVEKIMGNTFYIDFEAMGRDMNIEGAFVFLDDNICVQLLG